MQLSELLRKSKSRIGKIFILIFMFHCALIYGLLVYSQDNVDRERTTILEKYYNIILNISLNQLEDLTSQLLIEVQNEDLLIDTDHIIVEACASSNCRFYHISQFSSFLERYLPKFILFKIELNNKLIYTNNKIHTYDFEKNFQINSSHHFKISLDIERNYWIEKQLDIQKPFWFMCIFIGINYLFLLLIRKYLSKLLQETFSNYYVNKFKKELEDFKVEYMKKIWSINFVKQKDREINSFFMTEAKKLALLEHIESSIPSTTTIQKKPKELLLYPIILGLNDKTEVFDIKTMIQLFKERFNDDQENISLNISSNQVSLRFVSKVLFYQLIYSLLSNLFYLQQSQLKGKHSKYNIWLSFNVIEGKLQIIFKCEGLSLTKKKMTSSFFLEGMNNSNIYILSFEQIFNILKAIEFNYIINCDDDHTNIKLIQKKGFETPSMKNNIVPFNSFSTRKK